MLNEAMNHVEIHMVNGVIYHVYLGMTLQQKESPPLVLGMFFTNIHGFL